METPLTGFNGDELGDPLTTLGPFSVGLGSVATARTRPFRLLRALIGDGCGRRGVVIVVLVEEEEEEEDEREEEV